MGELHLEIIRDRLFREFKVEADSGKPQIAYRETITKKAHGVGKFVRQSGAAVSTGTPKLTSSLSKRASTTNLSTQLLAA